MKSYHPSLARSFSESMTEVLHSILRGEALALVLESVVERFPFLTPHEVGCAIMQLHPDGIHWVVGAASELPQDILGALASSAIPAGYQSVGARDQAGRSVTFEDMATHPAWNSVRDTAAEHGLRGCWSVPVFSSSRKVLGKLSIFLQVARSPTADEVSGMEFAAKIIGLGIENSMDSSTLPSDLDARANEIRYLEQRNALITLTRCNAPDSDGILNALRLITETTAQAVNLAQVAIWRYSPDQQTIECLDLYQQEGGKHSSGQQRPIADFPIYFKELGESIMIAAEDARSDPRLGKLALSYFVPHEIVSVIHVPVYFQHAVACVLCIEHVGAPRRWTDDEISFAVAIGNLVSVTLERAERARVQDVVLKSHQRFQSVAAATNDTIWDWDLETDAFWWNDGFANLFGWAATETEATIRVWIRQIHPEDRSRVVDGVYSAIARGETHWSDEYRFISNNGVTIVSSGYRLQSNDGARLNFRLPNGQNLRIR